MSKSKLNSPPKGVNEVEWSEICGGHDCLCFESKKRNISDYLELQQELWTNLNISKSNNTSVTTSRDGNGSCHNLNLNKLKQKSKSNLTMTFNSNRGNQRQMRGYDEDMRQINVFPYIHYYQGQCMHMRSRTPVPRIVIRCFKDFQNMGKMGVKKVIALVCLYLLLTTAALALLLPMLFTKENLEYRFAHAQGAPKFLLEAMLWVQSQVKFFPVSGMGLDAMDSTAHAHWQYITFFKSWPWVKRLTKTKLWLSFQSG